MSGTSFRGQPRTHTVYRSALFSVLLGGMLLVGLLLAFGGPAIVDVVLGMIRAVRDAFQWELF
jgi:hypothetical protein